MRKFSVILISVVLTTSSMLALAKREVLYNLSNQEFSAKSVVNTTNNYIQSNTKYVLELCSAKIVVILATAMILHYIWISAKEIKHFARRKMHNAKNMIQKITAIILVSFEAIMRVVVPVVFYASVYCLDIAHNISVEIIKTT